MASASRRIWDCFKGRSRLPQGCGLESLIMSPAVVLRLTKMVRVSSRLCIAVVDSLLRTMPSLVSALALIFLFPGVAKQQQQPAGAAIAIVGATIVDGTGRAPFQADGLLRGSRIAALAANPAL